jgi:hypothetical protein
MAALLAPLAGADFPVRREYLLFSAITPKIGLKLRLPFKMLEKTPGASPQGIFGSRAGKSLRPVSSPILHNLFHS